LKKDEFARLIILITKNDVKKDLIAAEFRRWILVITKGKK